MANPFDLDKTPVEVLGKKITNTIIALDESSRGLTEARGETVTGRDVENGLISVLRLDEINDVLDLDLDSAQIVSLLADVDFNRLRPEKLCEVTFEESILPVGFPLLLIEAEVRFKGEIWAVHKTDADPFPSNPHAHNYDRSLKLHLGNGDLYLRKERKRCGQMEKKNLVKLRGLVVQKNSTIALPPLTV